jgi:hypothetical protein
LSNDLLREMKIMGIFALSGLLYDWYKISEPYSWDDVYYEGKDRPVAKRETTEAMGNV